MRAGTMWPSSSGAVATGVGAGVVGSGVTTSAGARPASEPELALQPVSESASALASASRRPSVRASRRAAQWRAPARALRSAAEACCSPRPSAGAWPQRDHLTIIRMTTPPTPSPAYIPVRLCGSARARPHPSSGRHRTSSTRPKAHRPARATPQSLRGSPSGSLRVVDRQLGWRLLGRLHARLASRPHPADGGIGLGRRRLGRALLGTHRLDGRVEHHRRDLLALARARGRRCSPRPTRERARCRP